MVVARLKLGGIARVITHEFHSATFGVEPVLDSCEARDRVTTCVVETSHRCQQ